MRKLFSVLLIGLLLLLGCSTAYKPVLYFGSETPGPQLITEDYLRLKLAEKMSKIWTVVIAEQLVGPLDRFTSITNVYTIASHYDKDATVHVGWTERGPRVNLQRMMSFEFKGSDYDATGGSVTTGSCHELPDGGQKTTGEYQTFNNLRGVSLLEVKKTFVVTESTSSSINLTESIELSNKTTIEAGTDVAKVSDELDETFGISTSDTEDHSTTVEKGLELVLEVEVGQSVAVAGATNNTAVDCNVDINATGDWSKINVWIGYAYGPTKLTWGKAHAIAPTLHYNLGQLLRGDAIDKAWSADASFTFDQSDTIYRLALGYDIRCQNCGKIKYTPAARVALALMSDPDTRHVSFHGIRHSTQDNDATYIITDVTEADPDCVVEQFGTAGNPINDLEDC